MVPTKHLSCPHLTSTQPDFNTSQVLLSNVMISISLLEDPLFINIKKEAMGLKPRQLFLIEINMPTIILKAGKYKQKEKKSWHLKFYLTLTLLVLIYKH